MFQSDLGQYFIDRDEGVVPLNMVGYLYNHIGNCILNSIKRDYNKRVFHSLTKAVEIMVVERGEFLVKCHKYKPFVQTVKKTKDTEESKDSTKE